MLDNYDLKPAKLDEVIEIFTELTLMMESSVQKNYFLCNNFIEIARGKLAKIRSMIV